MSCSIRRVHGPALLSAAPEEECETAPSFLSRLHAAEGAAFAGRRELLERLEGLVLEADSEPRVVAVVGAPGVGKSALLRELARRRTAPRAVWMAAGHDPASWADSVARSVEGGIDALGRGAVADLLVVDAFERRSGLEAWLFGEALVRAGPRVCVVLVSRERVSSADHDRIRHHRDWAALSLVVRELMVCPLTDDEASEYLGHRGVPHHAQARLIEQASGYPLALRWMADELLLGAPDAGERADLDVWGGLAAVFTADAPSPLHVRGLFALSMVEVADEPMLAAMLGCGPDAAEVFAWLAGRAFVVARGDGLSPHGVVRAALHETLLRTEGRLHAEMAAGARAFMLRRRLTAIAAGRGSSTAETMVGALREALPKLSRPRDLAASPLLALRVVGGGGPAQLARVLLKAIDDLDHESGNQEAARVLRATYLGTSQKQEAAAAELGMPFGTYRHRLRAAIAELARALAEAERMLEHPRER